MASNAESPISDDTQSLLSIPREIRNKIYFELCPSTLMVRDNRSSVVEFGDESFEAVNMRDWQPIIRLQQACKQLQSEIQEEISLACNNQEVEMEMKLDSVPFLDKNPRPLPEKLVSGVRKVTIQRPILMYRYLPDPGNLVEDHAVLDIDEVTNHLDLFDLKLTYTIRPDKMVNCREAWKHINEGEPMDMYPIHMKAQQAFVGSKLAPLGELEFKYFPAFSASMALRHLRIKLHNLPSSWRENKEFKLNGDLHIAARVKEGYCGTGEFLWDVMEEITGESQFDGW